MARTARILTTGGRKIGYGHLTRCAGIAQALQECDVSTVICLDGPECESYARRSFPSLQFQVCDWQANLDKTIAIAEIVLIDTYASLDERFTSLSEHSRARIAYIDDTVRRDYAAGTAVIDWTIDVERTGMHKHRPDVIWLLGLSYAAMRREFWEIRPYTVKRELQSIAISMGGSDVRNLTGKIVNQLRNEFPGVKFEIIVGPGFADEIRSLRGDEDTVLHHDLDAAGMVEILQSSDLCIAAAGQTLYEIARVGIPSGSIKVAENQNEDVQGWNRIGAIRYCGAWNDDDLLARICSFIKEMRSPEAREKMAALQVVDGLGARRIAHQLTESRPR